MEESKKVCKGCTRRAIIIGILVIKVVVLMVGVFVLMNTTESSENDDEERLLYAEQRFRAYMDNQDRYVLLAQSVGYSVPFSADNMTITQAWGLYQNTQPYSARIAREELKEICSR